MLPNSVDFTPKLMETLLFPNKVLETIGFTGINPASIIEYSDIEHKTIFSQIHVQMQTSPKSYSSAGYPMLIHEDFTMVIVPQLKLGFGGNILLTSVAKFIKTSTSETPFHTIIEEYISSLRSLPRPDVLTPDGTPGIVFIDEFTKIIPQRSLESVWIPKEKKDTIINQIDTFFSPDEKKFYRDHGIPHNLKYVFAGLPGTGKTTFAKAIASHKKMPIFYINAAAPESNVSMKLRMCPPESIVLIEDIDTAFESMAGHGPPAMLAISSFINALDGVDSPENVIIIMTCNDTRILDFPAIRRGRINHIVSFEKMTKECIIQMISSYFPNESDTNIKSVVDTIHRSHTIIPSDLQAYILKNRFDFDALVKDLRNEYMSSNSYFTMAHDHNRAITNRYQAPEGRPGIF